MLPVQTDRALLADSTHFNVQFLASLSSDSSHNHGPSPTCRQPQNHPFSACSCASVSVISSRSHTSLKSESESRGNSSFSSKRSGFLCVLCSSCTEHSQVQLTGLTTSTKFMDFRRNSYSRIYFCLVPASHHETNCSGIPN